MGSDSYVVRSARRVLRDGTLWWKVIVLAVVQLVPIAGALFVGGFLMVVMRDAAWGVDRRLPSVEDSREILRRGLDGFIVSLVWGLPLSIFFLVGLIGWVILSMPAILADSVAPQIPWWIYLFLLVPAAFLSVFINVALLRAAVYLKASAGLSIRGVRQLIGLNADRFKQVAWLPVASGLIGAVLSLPALTVAVDPGLSPNLAITMPYIFHFLAGLVQVPLSLVVVTAYGLWAGETNPGEWPSLDLDRPLTTVEA